MRGLIITTLIIILSHSLFGQESKFVIRKGADIKKAKKTKEKDSNTLVIGPDRNFTEEYYVMKTDPNIRHGTYVKYRQTLFGGIQILETGSFQNGQQNGTWEYYHDFPMKNAVNSIKEKGQYVNGRKNGVWTSYYLDTIPEIIQQEKIGKKRKIDSIGISIYQQSANLKLAGMYLNDRRIGEWTSFTKSGEIFQTYNFSKKRLVRDLSIKDTSYYNTNRNALFIGGPPGLIDFLQNEFKLTGESLTKLKSDSTSVIVSFTIDKNGSVIEPKLQSSTGNKGIEKEALRLVSLSNNKWIPAVSEGTIVNSTYRIHFFIIKKMASSTYTQFRIGFNPIFE